MPSEPKRPVEQMLEALAKARRGEFGDDPKMPNPMRARLHAEIARTGRAENEGTESRSSWLGMFWPRLAVAAAMATLLVVVPAVWWNKTHPVASSGELASRERAIALNEESKPAAAAAPEDALAKGPVAASAPAPNVNLADNNQVRIEPEKTPASEAQTLDESRRLAEMRDARASPNQVTKGFVSKDGVAQTQPGRAAAPPAGAALKTESDKMAGVNSPIPSTATGALGAKQQFSQQLAGQSFRNNVQVKQTVNLLNTFQVQQQGSEIRVVDSDGSTYTGIIEQLAQNAKSAPAKQKRSYASQLKADAGSTEPQSYFRASGYNVSLKKTVVFEGNYTEPPALPAEQSLTADRPARTEQRQDRARIVGTARVNGGTPVQVDATAER